MAEDQMQGSSYSESFMVDTDSQENSDNANVKALQRQLEEANQKIKHLQRAANVEFASEKRIQQIVRLCNCFLQNFTTIVNASYQDEDDIEAGIEIDYNECDPFSELSSLPKIKSEIETITKSQVTVFNELDAIKQLVVHLLQKQYAASGTEMTFDEQINKLIHTNTFVSNKNTANNPSQHSASELGDFSPASFTVDVQSDQNQPKVDQLFDLCPDYYKVFNDEPMRVRRNHSSANTDKIMPEETNVNKQVDYVVTSLHKNAQKPRKMASSNMSSHFNRITNSNNRVKIQNEPLIQLPCSSQSLRKELDNNNNDEDQMIAIANRIAKTKHSLEISKSSNLKRKFEDEEPKRIIYKSSKEFRETQTANSQRFSKKNSKSTNRPFKVDEYHIVPPVLMGSNIVDKDKFKKYVHPLKLQKTGKGKKGKSTSSSGSYKSSTDKRKKESSNK